LRDDSRRAYYDGQGALWGRLGNPIFPPKWFIDGLAPSSCFQCTLLIHAFAALPRGITLDGELFAGRGQYQFTMSVIKSTNSVQWRKITFAVFDVPSRALDPFETRLGYLRGLFSSQPVSDNKAGVYACDHVHVLDHVIAKSRQHVLERLKQVQKLGGEGVMLRKPGS
jgi:DNA ligase-1